MANGFTFDLMGLEKALADIDQYGADVKLEVNDQLTQTGFEAVAMAKDLAPKDDGNLYQNIISSDRAVNEKIEIASNANYSGIIEFGSGSNVDVPHFAEGLTDLTAYAEQFRGEGKEGKHPVKFKDGSWAMVDYQLNFPARPFFFPSVQTASLNMVERLKTILADAKH